MTYGTARQATRAAKAAAVVLIAVSCSVYDASLLGGGAADGGHSGNDSSAGRPGTAGENDAGHSGSGAAKGGASGAGMGDAGMMDTAGVMETGGESSEGGSGATGGTGGSVSIAGSTGTGGSTGAGGDGTTAGSGGTAGLGGSGGSSAGAGGSAPATATGCAKLSVPIDDAMDRAHFVISFSSAIDMSNATTSAVSMRVYVKDGMAGTIFNYVQDSQYRFFGVTTPMRPPLNGGSGWQTLTFNVGSQQDGGSAGAGGSSPATGIAKTDVRRVGIEINAAPATSGWSPTTLVYVDSITVTTIPAAAAQNFTFDAASSVNTSTTLTADQSNNQLWLNSNTNDTKATGVTLTWVASCP